MITVLIIDSTIVAGRVAVAGEKVELSEQEAALLLLMGRAAVVAQVVIDPLAVRETTARRIPEKRIRRR